MKIKPGRRRKLNYLIVAAGIIVVGFLTWLTIGLITQKAELELVQTYELPDFTSLDSLREKADDVAVAIDGEVVPINGESAPQNPAADNVQLPTASTAKMILGLAIIQAKPFDPGSTGETLTMTEDDYARYLYYARNNGTNVQVQSGEVISEHDALMAVFLASANNMADSLAVWAFGSLDNYREYATQMLKKWGINDTTIGADASGFDPSTTSTPADLARIGQKVMADPVLAEIVNTQEYTMPLAGIIRNTNQLLGKNKIAGVKTGYIGSASGYCLVTGYREGKHIITTALLQAPTREASFDESLTLITDLQKLVIEQKIITAGDIVGYYDSWWTGKVAIRADADLTGLGWAEATKQVELKMNGVTGSLDIKIGGEEYTISVTTDNYKPEPSFGDRLGHLFGWQNNQELGVDNRAQTNASDTISEQSAANSEVDSLPQESANDLTAITNAPSNNCTREFGYLMLINPNFTVEDDFIAARRGELISLSANYGIVEGNAGNGDNLLDAEAAKHINEMLQAYTNEYPGHSMQTFSCFRAVGTSCGRLCAATGTSDHHTGLTCDLADPAYGTSLDTSTYNQHPDWQWLRANSYKYGFIDRFPEAWAGGSMDEPLNVDANGTTGLYETWHYRYVGAPAAEEIATGKYNNGQYDSLEHYLLTRGLVTDLKTGTCK